MVWGSILTRSRLAGWRSFKRFEKWSSRISFACPDKADLVQTTYASGFLYIGALTAIKISICLHLTSLTPVQLHRTIILALGAFVCVWMVSCFFIIGFQCHLPHPWQFVEGQCIDTAGFWTYAHIINILTNSALIVLPWLILSRLQMKATRKYIIIGCFTARVL